MEKSYWEKSCKYSIRKLTIGTASVLLGAVFLATQNVAADSLEVEEKPASVSATTVQVDTKVEEPTQENKEKQPSTENQASTELASKEMKVEKEAPQTNSQSEANAVAEPSENKESEKPELPMTKQENYQLHYDQPTAPSYDGWEKQALPVGNGEMGAKVFGLIGEERIQYNEKTLWSGGPKRQTIS